MRIKLEKFWSKNLLIPMVLLISLSFFSIEMAILAVFVLQYSKKRSLEELLISFVVISAAWFLIDKVDIGPQHLWKILFLLALFVLSQRNFLVTYSPKSEMQKFDTFTILSLSIIHCLILLQGEKGILRNLLIGYDNVGHFSMLKTLAQCDDFLTDCKLTGIATPEGYRNYPQYFHYSFSSFMNLLGEGNSLHIYFIISSTVYILLVFFMFRIFNQLIETQGRTQPNSRRNPSKVKKSKKSEVNQRKQNYSKAPSTVPLKILILLGVTYIHSLGYLNFEYSILLILVWVSCIQQKLLLNPLFVSLFLFMASSSSYPLIVIPSCLIFLVLILNPDFRPKKITSVLYSFSLILFTLNMILGNLSTNSEFITSIGGSSEYMFIVLALVATFLYIDIFLHRNILSYLEPARLLSLNIATYFAFTIFLFLFNLIRGESAGYYTQKMCMILMLLVIPEIYVTGQKIGLWKRLYNQVIAKLVSSLLIVVATLNVSPDFILTALKQKLFFVAQPAIYIRELITFPGSKDSQSGRIITATQLDEQIESSLLIYSKNAVQDTIWVNAIRSSWGAELEKAMLGGVLSKEPESEVIYTAEDNSYQVAILKIGKHS